MRLSLIVPTRGRAAVLPTLLDSLVRQSVQDFEVIVVDQNEDDRLVEMLRPERWPFPLRHLRTPDAFGASRARNAGLRHAAGDIVLFPDDDCWYPPWFLERALGLFHEHGGTAVAGRAADTDGRSINGRYDAMPGWIGRHNIWTTQIEWVVLFRREALVAVGGYDESIGVGAGTPWGAGEGQELMLRMLAAGYSAYYTPDLYGHHPELTVLTPDAELTRKGRAYARGMGYVLRRHRFSPGDGAYWIARPAIGAMLNLLRGRLRRGAYLWNVAAGRYEGWTGGAPSSSSASSSAMRRLRAQRLVKVWSVPAITCKRTWGKAASIWSRGPR